ncbi:FtsX-like permease family protein [Nocardioides sp.]|uniref:FtsX-like permease family protein n=1 Tax=Nocardioides sp. TaxID=35761 RepID=UPI003526D98A
MASAAALVLTFAGGGLTGPAALVAPDCWAWWWGSCSATSWPSAFAGLGRRLLARGRMPWALGLLDAARSPSTRRVVAVVTVAAAIAVFSADALMLIGARNRASAAEQEAGARMVTYVEGADVVGVRDALTAADPDGVDTTPVVRVSAPGAGAVETLAVEPDSFRSVALFPGAAPSEALWNRLAAPDSSPIALVGSRASLEVRGSSLTSVLIGGRRSAVAVGLDLLGDAGRAVHVELGRIAPAQRHATLTAAVPCRQGCQVVGLWFGSLPGARVRGAATVSALTQLPAGTRVELGSAVHWSGDDGDGPAPVTLTDGAEGLDVRVRGDGGAVLSARHDWVLSEVPVLATTSLRQPVDTATTIAGLDGEDRAARVAGLLTRVPGSARQMYVANLDTMLRGPAAGPTARVEIWYARADPELRRRVLAALDERGIRASGTTSLDDVRRGYDESASAWSLQLAVLVGAASLLIALLVLVVSAASSWRLRTRDLAALRMTGAGAAMLRRSAVVGQLPAVLVAGVVGGAAGALGARLAMPLVPLFATPPEVSTLDLHTPWAGVAVVLAGVLAGLSVGSLLIGRALARAADVSLLRESVP